MVLATSSVASYGVVVTSIAPTPSHAPSPFPAIRAIALGAPIVDSVALLSSVYYVLTVAPGAVPLGFTIRLQPAAGQDADLHVNVVGPMVLDAAQELASTAGMGALDTVSITPTSPFWRASGPYYMRVVGISAANFQLSVVAIALPSTASPLPTAGAAMPLLLSVPQIFTGVAAGQAALFSLIMSPDSIPAGFSVRLQPTLGTNADLALSTTPPVGAAFSTPRVDSRLGAGATDYITLTPANATTSPGWLPGGGVYYIQVVGVTATSAFTLVVVPLEASPTPSQSGTRPPSITASQTARSPSVTQSAPSATAAATLSGTTIPSFVASPLPSAGALMPLGLGAAGSVQYAALPAGATITYVMAGLPAAAAPSGVVFYLQSLFATDCDLQVSTIAPAGGAFTSQLSSTLGTGTMDSVTLASTDVLWRPTNPLGPFYVAVNACEEGGGSGSRHFLRG